MNDIFKFSYIPWKRVVAQDAACLFCQAFDMAPVNFTIFLNKIPAWEIQHVSREENLRADALANKGIDSQSDMR